MKKYLLILSFILYPLSLSAMDIIGQYHLNVSTAVCPDGDWAQWVNTGELSGQNACTFIGGTTWHRQTSTVSYPLIGPYTGGGADLSRWQIRLAKAAGYTGFLVSVFPGSSAAENTLLMDRFLVMLQVASEENFKLGLEFWEPLGTNANYYAQAKTSIDRALASPYASALYKINNLPVVWFDYFHDWDSIASLTSNLLNTRQVFWMIGGTGTSIADLNSMTLTNGAEKTTVEHYNYATTTGCGFHGGLTSRLNSLGAAGYKKISHTYPGYNNKVEHPGGNFCLRGTNNDILTNWNTESLAATADVGIIESWNDFRESTFMEPGISSIPYRNVGQEDVFSGDPYKPLKKVASMKGVTWVTPQLRCSILDPVMVGITSCVSASTIARTGSCAAAGTSCNLSGVTAGDLVLTFAYRSGSVTAPGAAANNTSIRTGQTSGGQNTASYRLSCRRATGGDVSSGVFPNATGVVSIAYEGTNVNATADCQTTGIGARGATGNGVNWSKGSTTVSYQTLALQKTDNTAWVVGFMGGSASATCTPTSLTNRASAGVVRVSDSNATVTGFSTATCGVSSETWMSETLEILPVPVPPTGDTEAPSVPAGLTLAAISPSQINLTWTASTDTGTGSTGVTEYRVERCTGTGCGGFLEIENPPSNSYDDIGLTASTSYSYRVRASDLVGNLSGFSTTATISTTAVTPSSNQIGEAGEWRILDDFTTQKLNGDGGRLFESYIAGTENTNQTVTEYPGTPNKIFSLLAGNSDEIYWHFMPYSGGYFYPKSYLQAYMTTIPTSWPNANRMQFLFRPTASSARRPDGGTKIELGTYIRSHTGKTSDYQGQHYYHIFDPNLYANKWHLVVINRTPQHKVASLPGTNWGENPEAPGGSVGLENVNYFDGMTRFYWDSQYDNTGETWSFKNFEIGTVTGTEDNEIASIMAVYSGTAYEISWASLKNTARTFDIRYSTTGSMKTNGFTSGTSGGTASNPASDYTGTFWASPAMAEANPGIWIAIRRQGATNFTELWLPYGMQPSAPPAAATNVAISRRRIQ